MNCLRIWSDVKNNIFINGELIKNKNILFDDENEWNLQDKEEHENFLIELLSQESLKKDYELIKDDLKAVLKESDRHEFIFISTFDNEMILPDRDEKEYNRMCEILLKK